MDFGPQMSAHAREYFSRALFALIRVNSRTELRTVCAMRSGEQFSLNTDVDAVKAVGGGQDERARRRERQADDARSREEKLRFAIHAESDHAFAATERCRHIKPIV